MNVTSVVGARPQFIKAAPVSRALRDTGHTERILHTGQHYDHGLSQVFFDELGIPEPDVNLGIGSGPHGQQTGRMLACIEEVLLHKRPDCVLVYGDTNSTLAAALAACKLQIPLAHVEAGLRSHNRQMPEEHNRVMTDHCSNLLFCPTETAVDNLAEEGITEGVRLVGDTMYDAILELGGTARQRSTILEDWHLIPRGYLLATVHRPYNTDVPQNLRNILAAFVDVGEPIIFPVHPRTRKRIEELEDSSLPASNHNVRMVEPVSYLDMLALEQNARMILTDSGGMQKEAYFFGVPCLTLRPETEWIETVEAGWNVVVGTDPALIVKHVQERKAPPGGRGAFGDGHAAQAIVDALEELVRHSS